MHILREWIHRLRGTLHPRRRDDDLEQELRLHLELAAEDARRRGLAPDAAVRAAAIEAGGSSQAMDALREQRGVPWLDDLVRDLRHGLRALRRSPVFTAVALLTLALGIGANTAIFTIVNGVILRPLAYPKPEQVMYLHTHNPTLHTDRPVAPAEYFEFRAINRSFAEVGALTTGEVNLTAADRPLRVRAALVDVWKGQNPIGQRLKPNWADWVPWFTVIGVAKDVKQGGVDRNAGTEFYFFVEQMAVAPSPLGRAPATVNVVLRTTLPPSALAQTIERTVHEVDPTVPVARLRDMDAVFAESIRRPRLLAQLMGAFAGLALLLAAVGTYGVLSYMVIERRREIGIRMALGADRSSVLALVMKQGLQLTVIGVVVGLAGALALNRLIASLLFSVQPTDTTTLAAVIAIILLVAAVACWLPAWRASRLDPSMVLRAD